MDGRTEVIAADLALPAVRGSAVRALPRRQAAWVATQIAAAVLLSSLWATQPALALCLSLAAGVSMVNWRKLWTFPLVAAAVSAAGMATSALELSPVIGAGAMAGAIAVWLLPEPSDWLDHVHGALGVLTGSSVGLWLATVLTPAAAHPLVGVLLSASLVGLLGSAGMAPLAFKFDHPSLPSRRAVRRALQPALRPEVFQAFDLYYATQRRAPDTATRRGLCEVATWVFRLQVSRQTLETELETIDPEKIQARIAACDPDNVSDEFMRERLAATAEHLRRLLAHREAIELEWRRTQAVVEYALAFLEEARASLAIAQQMPGDTTPDRLPEVLQRLRTHAASGDARRRTAREMGAISV